MLRQFVRYSRILLPVLYKLVFEILYYTVISPMYSYYGTRTELNGGKLIVSWIVFFLLMAGMAMLGEDKLKSFFRFALYFSVIPSLSIYGLKNESTTAFALIALYWILALLTIAVVQHSRSYVLSNRNDGTFLPDGNAIYMWAVFFWVLASTVYMWARYGGMRLFVSFADVYTIRNADTSIRSYEKYLLGWNTTVLIPLSAYVFCRSKKYLRFVVCLILMVLSYSIFGDKSMFFTVLFVAGVLILAAFRLEHLTDIIIGLFLLLYQCLCFVIPGGTIPALAHRMLVIPAEGHYYYFDYFQGHELLYLRQSILRRFIADPYDRPVSMIIGGTQKYYPAVTEADINNMNNGFFSDAYQNFGTVGAIVYPIVIVLTLAFVFKRMQAYEQGFQYIVLIMFGLYLMSGYYFSWLLSGGVILLLLCLTFIQKHDTKYSAFVAGKEIKGL